MKVNCKSLYPSKSGFEIDENLNWKQQIHDIVIKLNRANALLLTIRNHFKKHILRTIYSAIFDFTFDFQSYMGPKRKCFDQNCNPTKESLKN